MSECYFCKSEKVNSIFKIDECPIAGNFLKDTKDDYLLPLDILFCTKCGIAQVDKTMLIPKEKLFENYFYKTHSIKTLVDFFYNEADKISNGGKNKVLEIGGNIYERNKFTYNRINTVTLVGSTVVSATANDKLGLYLTGNVGSLSMTATAVFEDNN